MRLINWFGCIMAAGLSGCSLYPITDDVSIYSTEQIVRYARCEIRSAILEYMKEKEIIASTADEQEIASRLSKARKRLKDGKTLDREEKRLLILAKVAAVYSFDFNITEHNKTSADAGFKFPGLTNVVDLGATGTIDLTRQGSRVFSSQDSWDSLITDPMMCNPYRWERSGNVVYPLTGSVGVGRVVSTFIDIYDQGGAKDNFVDTLTFTTDVSGGVGATIKLDPVPQQFRPVSGAVGLSASRLDVHKLTISLAFPQPDGPPSGGISGVTRVDGDLNAPFTRPALWRARYNLCVQDARTRENAFRILRLEAPEVYCIRYADAFAPTRLPEAEVIRVELQGPGPRSSSVSPGQPSGAPAPAQPSSTPAPAQPSSGSATGAERPALAPSRRSVAPHRLVRPDARL
ncbi:hypothetical protein [Bradyrhizobium sp. SZCCHNRI3042]|uniref:hypothetical protein n=1 Tax=Bradyrhizobium sp. SZCCHNRI3042 TaxID=3057291 RepID=UPI002916E498|nr:hypothetical protein [Bradyrhizobium sp. SZCCHNRI3042]